MSFSEVLTYLAELLRQDAGLSGVLYRPVTVIRRYQHRSEIHVSDLPLIMITRPRVSGVQESIDEGFQEHTVALYCGFNCEDREVAQDILIRFEEAIENAIMNDPTLGRRVLYTSPGDSANDEGKLHPVYFFVKEIKISTEVVWK